MSDLEIFTQNIQKVYELAKEENYLMDRIDKTIKEVFRDNSIIAHSIKINPDGFTCLCKSPILNQKSLNGIIDFFGEKYQMDIEMYECNNFLFKFKKL